ncbi:MAG: GatB/YqeY domain-containing protein [Candidatus Aadella gelida]|nr:GatB/YqeY domain-containing protein [Candidatus Aadella gelida]
MNEKIITTEINAALKSGDKVKVSVFRMLLSDVKNLRIEKRVKELDEKDTLTAMKKMVKRYKDSIEQFKQAGRDDLVEKETGELDVLLAYMPKEMSEDEIKRIVDEAIDEVGAKTMADMGSVMKIIQERTSGRADGKIVSQMVKDKLI